MKILAIRGKNLASLAGEFELRFQHEPLASTGLFAICGPTGAGKSTLLDALCLALYNNTPRLAKASGRGVNLPDVGTETITPRDPGNLLRRGAGAGYAEVDFIGNDGIEYRARWSVRRARGKTGGKLQNVEMSLQRLSDDQALGGGKTEVQHEIEQRLGLNFEQFTRAVLLAQNEFATFLKAEDDERAALLETLTGLDTYTHLSIRAFERAKVEKNALDALKEQLGSQQPLDPERRRHWENTLTTAQAEAIALEQRQLELAAALRWYESRKSLQQAVQQAQAAVESARCLQHAATPRQAYLARIEQVQEARPLLREADRASGEILAKQQAVAQAQARLAETQRDRLQADQALNQTLQAITHAEHAKTAVLPDLERAKKLDTEILALQPHHKNAASAQQDASQAETEIRQQQQNKQAERADLIAAQAAAKTWLDQQESLRPLAEDWPRWNLLFEQAAQLQAETTENKGKISDQRQTELQQRQRRDQAAATLTHVAEACDTTAAQLQNAIAALSAFDPDALAVRRSDLEHQRDDIIQAEHVWTTLSTARAQQQQWLLDKEQITQHCANAEREWMQAQDQKPRAIARREQATQSLKIAEAACSEGVEALRYHLQPDGPCPVCGSLEHPYITGDAPSHTILTQLRAELTQCQEAVTALERQEAAAQANLNSSRQRLALLNHSQKNLTDTVHSATTRWNAHPVAATLAALTPVPTDPLTWLISSRQWLQGQLAQLLTVEQAWRQAAKRRDSAQTAHDQAQQRRSIAQEALSTAQITLDQNVQALQTAMARQHDLAVRLKALLAALDTLSTDPHWQQDWCADPAAYHRTQTQQAAQWNRQHQTVEQASIQLAACNLEIQNLDRLAADKAAHLRRLTDEFTALDHLLLDKRVHRNTLLGGRAVAMVEAALDEAIEAAKAPYRPYEQAKQQAEKALARAEALLQQAHKALIESQQAASHAQLALEGWIATFNRHHHDNAIDLSELQALLSQDPTWIVREREDLSRLADAVRDAETTLRERLKRQEAHDQQRQHPEPFETLQVTHEQVKAAQELAQQQATEATVTLRQDNERRHQQAALLEAIERQDATRRLWGQLSELIGAADGKKFRNYAQGFTLDILLGYANHHLTDLTRRYRLERVKETLALMVVDQDMGDEPRSVHSLSGGESFLVSLALALGLASLSSNRVRVESLFIDEGFGSLDTDTLRIAMDALDNLQAQGRKVGVISHVQEMTERIGIQIQVRRQSGGQSQVEVTNS